MINFTGAGVVDLDLPLSQPATGLLFELAESADFFLRVSGHVRHRMEMLPGCNE